MRRIPLDELPVVIEDGPLQVRLRDEAGLSVGHRAPARRGGPAPCDQGPAGRSLPVSPLGLHDQGQGPDAHDRRPPGLRRGEAFYWGPGDAPEALEDSEYVDFSPTDKFLPVIEHITSGGGG